METEAQMARRITQLLAHLDERGRRMVVASEAQRLGRGGISRVSVASGISRVTITKGLKELKRRRPQLLKDRMRRPGAGRPSRIKQEPALADAIMSFVTPSERGDPETPLRWTCKSTRTLSSELARKGHSVSHETVAQFLKAEGFSLQGNRKGEEGNDHPDRDRQFLHINKTVTKALALGLPVISVDTKKKELVGNYENKGVQWRPKKSPRRVNGHDFPGPDVPRAFPYGIYDVGRNTGFVNVGTDHDTGAFSVASIKGWWHHEGRSLYPETQRLVITADGGGSNGYRLRLWKMELQKFADAYGLVVSVCHFPPGTSKWNKVEHRLFSFISSNWRGEPLQDYETIVNLIASTTTAKGLSVTCRLDRRRYATGRRIGDANFSTINLMPDSFHGEWNYSIHPRLI